MWRTLRASSQAEDLIEPIQDLLKSTSYRILLVVGIVILLALSAGAIWPEELSVKMWTIAPIALVTYLLALRLLPQHFLLAHAAWQIGIGGVIAATVSVFQLPEIAFLAMLLPLMAVVTGGWPLGVLSQALVTLLALALHRGLVTPVPPPTYGWLIGIGGMIAGLLGWAAIQSLLTVTQWSLYSYRQARDKVEEARNQRLEFKQVEGDLLQANQELARMAERLRAMNDIAEEARQAKEEFVANVSHELRTPLNMIIGFSEMITQAPQIYGTHLPPPLLADITAIQRNSQHLSKLVNDVLDLSQIEAGRMAITKEWAQIGDVVEEAISAVRFFYESKALFLETEIPSDLPKILCDGTRVRQILLNLLSNAGRFTEEGGVIVRAEQTQQELVVSVSDTGPGISPEDQSRLFEPFQQLDSSIRRQHGGSGLGLSISQRFVELHGGRMWLESQVGDGTTFYFSLPMESRLPIRFAEGNNAKRWFDPHQQYVQRTRRTKAPRPVLIPRFVVLEREKVVQKLLSRYLDNIEVIGVTTMDDALHELRRLPAQALVVNTPDIEAYTDSKIQLEALPYGTPMIICWVPGEETMTQQLGAARYLVKPIARDQLLEAIQQYGDNVRSILLVEDDSEAIQLFARMLASSETPYDVLLAKNGRRALDLLERRHPDLVLLDLIMPGMDGFEVLERKQRDPALREVPVIIISSQDPSGHPIVSKTLVVARHEGISARDLVASIQAVSQKLTPSGRAARQAQPETASV
jgi:signal transduction histidine kinase/CheY-like chemotaxis protein